MPRYEFLCATCGQVDIWRSFAEASLPASCPVCQAAVKRVYTLPGVTKTSAPLTRALDRAQKSAYEPEVVKRQQTTTEARPAPVRHQHGRPWQLGH